MDQPATGAIQSGITSTQDIPYTLPQVSQSTILLAAKEHSSTAAPSLLNPQLLSPVSPASASGFERRKSLRLRPSENLDSQNAEPIPLTIDSPSAAPSLRPATSKMSLFHLFSKPKVEKLRGYAESGLDGPPRGISNNNIAKPGGPGSIDTRNSKLPPPTSKAAAFPTLVKHARGTSPLPPGPLTGAMERMRTFEPPPLFQVWPQAIKHASFEVSTVAQDSNAQKSRTRALGATIFASGTELQSLQMADWSDRRTASRQASITASHLPTKLIVLVTSGYLLQYAASGPSDRYPEKILQLQKESAAFASDLIPGKHHVLQVVQSVSDAGIVTTPSTSLFSKFGLRSQSARRSTSNMLLVMTGAEDMKDWMSVIRKEIERHGGKHARADSSTSHIDHTVANIHDRKKEMNLSHRYKVKRDTIITNLSTHKFDQESMPVVDGMVQQDEFVPAAAARNHSECETCPPRTESPASRRRANSDTPSASSSTAQSEDQKQLDSLKDSTRSSQASTEATTLCSPTSRTSSLTSTPATEVSKESPEPAQDYMTSKGPFRNLASYTLPTRRSSAFLSKQSLPLSPKGPSVHFVARSSESMEFPPSKARQRVEGQGIAQSQPVGTHGPDVRPSSTIGELPNGYGQPKLFSLATMTGMQRSPPKAANKSSSVQQSRHLRPKKSSQSFSLPLRINPSNGASQRVVSARGPRTTEPDSDLRSPIPAATTLVAKFDPSTQAAVPHLGSPQGKSFAERAATSAVSARSAPPSNLSLFPPEIRDPSTIPALVEEDLHCPPSMASLAIATATVQQLGPFRRPASLQVRTSQYPFISSMRAPPASFDDQQLPTATTSVRVLKTSRSAATLEANARPTSTVAFASASALPRESAEEVDRAMPLPHTSDPAFKLPGVRKVRASASLPALDMGLPVVCLGPPAPPPQMPLPELPTCSRSGSRTSLRPESRSTSRSESRQGTLPAATHHPIGVAVTEAQPHNTELTARPVLRSSTEVSAR